MLISFCVSYPFSTPGSLEGLHLLLLSSGPLECGDQKGIDDPFSELIDMKRHLFGFRSGDDDDDSKYGDLCGEVDDIDGDDDNDEDDDDDDDRDDEEDCKENLPQINLYWFCTAARWKNNLMKNEESQRLFKNQIFYVLK